MFYLVSRAMRRLKWNAKIYGFIVLELVVGFTIIASQINVAKSIERRLYEYEKQYTESGISINAYTKDMLGGRNNGVPVTKADYDYIAEKYGQMLEISYISYGAIYTRDLDTITVLGMSEVAFQKMFQVKGNSPYIGAEAKAHLEKENVILGDLGVVISSEGIYVNETEYLFKEFDKAKNSEQILSFAPTVGYDKTVRECIIIPVSMQDIFEEFDVLFNCTLELIGKEGISLKELQEKGNEVLVYLSETHDECSYEISNKIEDYQKSSSDLSDTIRVLSWIAKFALFLIVVGMVGVLFILLERRKKDFAISFWVGAERWKLVVELLLEMLLLCFTAGGISLAFSLLIAPALSSSQYAVTMSHEAVGMVGVLCFIIAVATSMTSLFYIRTNNARV
ncbi:MAG: hypothetical protein IJ282_00520 [Lachnospiraceae bacterium]|nr:hypothetical protein [Lachnospiraceae bacterium]